LLGSGLITANNYANINSILVVVFGRGFPLVSHFTADFVSMLEVRMEMRLDLARYDCRKCNR
jgi:hypothetical protein